jgi:hypothetical protein
MLIESFLQQTVMMIEEMPTIRRSLLRILSQLSEVSESGFGQNCMKVLQDLLDSGPAIIKDVNELLREVIIPKLKTPVCNSKHKDLIIGLKRLCEAHHLESELSVLVDSMVTWLKTQVGHEEDMLTRGAGAQDEEAVDSEVMTYAISLLSVASADKDNARVMEKSGAHNYVSRLLKLTERRAEPSDLLNQPLDVIRPVIEKLMALFKLVEVTSEHSVKVANVFVREEMPQKLLRDITHYLTIYKANDYNLGSSGQKGNDEDVIYYQLVSSYIYALKGLCSSTQTIAYFNSDASRIRDELLTMSTMPRIDPVLCTAILDLTRKILESGFLDSKPRDFENYVHRLQKLLPFLPYFSEARYPELCQLGQRYFSGTMIGQEPIPMSSLNNTVVHNLFIAVINIIKYFSGKAQLGTTEVVNKCKEVSQALNESSREQCLFNALEIPSDIVKLAVVKCLDKVPLKEIDIDEIGHIVRVLASYKNLGVGKTEEVLAQIFLLLCKMCKKREDFRVKFGEMVMTECLSIAKRNQERDLGDEEGENQEKMYLTMSCVMFLKECSLHDNLKNHLNSLPAQRTMRSILKAEENFKTYNELPCDIDRTYIGDSIEAVMKCFVDADGLMPYHRVSLRVLMRLADNLQFKPEAELPNPWRYPNRELLETLEEAMEEIKSQRIKTDKEWWPVDIPEPPQDPKLDQKHLTMVQTVAIQRLLEFLMGRSTINSSGIEDGLKREYDNIYETQEYGRIDVLKKALAKKEELDLKYQERKRAEETKMEKAKNVDEVVEDAINPEELLKTALKEQAIGAEYFHGVQITEGEDELFMTKEQKIAEEAMELRALSIAVYLRIIIALIEFAPKEHTKEQAIAQIRDNTFLRNLTKLCATTKWLRSCVGAKYLAVMKYVVRPGARQNSGMQEDVILFEIISLALQSILKNVRQRLASRERKPLTTEEHFLIAEATSIASHICSSIVTIHWHDDFKTVYAEEDGATVVYHSVQDLMCGFLLETLIPIENIEVYCEILFYDSSFSKRFDKASYNREPLQMTFMDKARSALVEVLGTYCARCEDQRYKVLELCQSGIAFSDVPLRTSYMQDILNQYKMALYSNELSKFMLDNSSAFNLSQSKIPERITALGWCDMTYNGSNAWQKRLALVTSRCFLVLNPPSSKACTLCGDERFCPTGPTFDYQIEYFKIKKVVSYRNIKQLISIQFDKPSAFGGSNETIAFFIFHQYKTASQIKECLEELLLSPEEVGYQASFEYDYFLEHCLAKYLETQNGGAVKETVLCSINPTDFGLFAKERVFRNGVFCVFTHANELFMLNFNMTRWPLLNEESHNEVADLFTEAKARTTTDSISKAVAPHVPEPILNLTFGGTEHVFQFGDDRAMDLFLRNAMKSALEQSAKAKVGKKGRR